MFRGYINVVHFNLNSSSAIQVLTMNELPEGNASNPSTDLETLDYLRGVKSSTCLLLPMTPSPTPLDFKHPLSEEINEEPFLTLNDNQKIDLQNAGTEY